MQLPISTMRYDITMPLLDGRVQVPGVDLVPTPTGAMVFNEVPALQSGDFGLWDLNLGYVLPAIEVGWEIVGLPLMIKRKPVYTFIFARADAGIETPKDLEGKRIGSGSYPTSITVWTAGLLQHRHGRRHHQAPVDGHQQPPRLPAARGPAHHHALQRGHRRRRSR